MEQYIDFLKTLGIEQGKVIDPGTVVTAPWVCYRCQYGCDFYGKSHCCPPKSPTYERTRAVLDAYSTGILFTSQTGDIKKAAVALSRKLFLDGYYKALAFGSGPCTLCKTCNPDACNFPKKAIPSMEACGIDVFATARANGFVIDVVQKMGDPQNCFGLVLV